MYQRNAMQYLSTVTGGTITALTGRGYLGGIYAYCSAGAGSIIVSDSAAQIFVWSGATAGVLTYFPIFPVAVTGGLSITGSGSVAFSVSYATQ